MLVTTLADLTEALNKANLGEQVLESAAKLLSGLKDYGLEERIISGVIEPITCQAITTDKQFDRFKIQVLKRQNRTFFDWLVLGHLVNFKCATCTTQDNLSAQGAVLHSLSGDPDWSEKNKRLDHQYLIKFEAQADKAKANGVAADFGYVILNKKTSKFHYCTLRTLSRVVMNQSNWLQANWAENIDRPVTRTNEQYIEWIRSEILKYRGYNK